MMVSYYNSNELEMAKTVKDKDLNELLQEVREKDDRYYLQEFHYITKKPFRKEVKTTLYTLLLNTYSCECQIINFCQDHSGSINGRVTKSYIYTLFCGFLNGYKSAVAEKV